MKKWLAHKLHPLHVWCRFQGGPIGKKICRLYEDYLWQPILRKILGKIKVIKF
jgi:hypothetical protein